MFKLAIHHSAAQDIQALAADPRTKGVAARTMALVREFKDTPARLGDLLDEKYATEDVDVSKWQAFWNRGADVWRLKFLKFEDPAYGYRIIYAYHVPTRTFHVLAVVHRDFDYAPDHPITERVRLDYANL